MNNLLTREHMGLFRWMILVLFVISMLGPWIFDSIYVPAEYSCEKPFIRMKGDFCGSTLSGFFVSFMFTGSFFSNLALMISGTFTGQARELIVGLFLPPFLPFFTTLLLIWKKETRRLQTINLTAWILALIPTLFLFVSLVFISNDNSFRLWGFWLYMVTAISAVIVEFILLKRKTVDT
jgi:hypothetical protein